MRTTRDIENKVQGVSEERINEAVNFAIEHYEQHLDEMTDFVGIPSIGTKPENQMDTIRAARWLADSLKTAGLENVALIETDGQPLVYGDWLHAGSSRPTILFYGHYDVQPPEPLDEWRTPPFEPTIIDDYIYGRGTADDKCQLYIHVKSIEATLKATGSLPLNVKCLFEGEEEHGGKSIARFVRENPELLAADTAVISDTHMLSPEQPAVVSSMRGICYVFMDVHGPVVDLHSGSYGGVIDNPLNAASHIIAGLKGKDGKVLIPGFYDDVRSLTNGEREALSQFPISAEELLSRTGASQIWGEPGYSLAERLGTRPTLDVNGIIGGYTAKGQKTIIPASVHVKISMRLVSDQDGQKIFDQFKKYVESITPPSVRVTVTLGHQASPGRIDTNKPSMRAAEEAFLRVFNKKPLYLRMGGTIPVVADFKDNLGIDSVMMGFGLPDDNIHSPNERFYLPNFRRGIETAIHFMEIFGNQSQ